MTQPPSPSPSPSPSTSSSPSPRITVVGDALIDEIRDPGGSREFIGGAALNVAVGLSLLGEDVTLIAMLGDDDASTRIRAYLRDFGVRLVASPSAHGTSRAISDRTDGEPRYEFNDAAKRRGIRFDAETRDALDTADLVVVSCFPFDDAAQYSALVAAIERPQHRVVVDGNPRAGMLADRPAFLANFEDFASRALLTKVGDEDAGLLLGDTLDAFVDRLRHPPGAGTGAGTGSGTGAGASDGDGAVILATAGRDGATVHDGPISVHADIASLPGAIVDTMGAGDATLSAIVHHLAQHGVPKTADAWRGALLEAMTIAAATVRHEGALLRVPRPEPVFPS